MIRYSMERIPSREAVTALFLSVNWESAQFPASLSRAITGAEFVQTAWEGDRLVGLMTAISDGGMNVFFPYLVIHPQEQGKGIGRELVARMLRRYEGSYRKILVCNEDKAAFYEKCGFSACPDQCLMMCITPPGAETAPES